MTKQQTMLEAALKSEEGIAEEAADLRAEVPVPTLDFALFMTLWPLLKRPIPAAFIQTVSATKGKPYPSTGIRSVQVQIDRMNNVLTPLWWWDEATYENHGKLCSVTIGVGSRGSELLTRTSRGGVSQGSTEGNIYKGSYTNAAKVAFARMGPGHEVYLGAADLDPDVSEEVAEAPTVEHEGIPAAISKKLAADAFEVGEGKRLRLAASRLADRDVGDCSNPTKAAKALMALTYDQAEQLGKWLAEQETKVNERG